MRNLFVFFAVIFAFGVQAFAQVITTSFERGGYIVKEYSLNEYGLVTPEMWKDSVLSSAEVLTDQSDEKKVYLEMLIYSDSIRPKIVWGDKPKYYDLLSIYSNQIEYLLKLESCPLDTPKTKWGFSAADLNKLTSDAFASLAWTYYMLYTRNGKTDIDRESVLYYANKALVHDSTNYQAWTYLARVYYQEIAWENIYGLTLLLKDSSPTREEARKSGLTTAEIIVEKSELLSLAIKKAEEYGIKENESWTKCLIEEGKKNLEHYNGLIESLKEMVENKN